MKHNKVNNRKREGQVMLLSIVLLGGVILSATAIGGLLMVFQIRQGNDAVNSAKALFAADTGLEWETYNRFTSVPGSVTEPAFDPILGSVSFVSTTTIDAVLEETTITSQGFSNNSVRALEAVFFTPGI